MTVLVGVSEDGYHVRGPGVTTTRAWDTFRHVRRVGDFWVLRTAQRVTLALPVAALDERQTAAFTAPLRAKGLLKP